MTLMDHSSAQSGGDRARGRVRRDLSPGHFTVAVDVLSRLSLGTWAHGRGRRDVVVWGGGGGSTGGGDRNPGALEREN